MDALDFVIKISWQLVALVGLIVLGIYRGPLGSLLERLIKGQISRDKDNKISMSIETSAPTTKGNEKTKEDLLNPSETANELLKEIANEEETSGSETTLTASLTENKEVQIGKVEEWRKYYDEGKFQEAFGSIQTMIAITTRPEDKLVLKVTAANILSRFDFKGGESAFKKLIDEGNSDFLLFWNYENIYESHGLLVEAVEAVNVAIDKAPKLNKGYFLLEKANLQKRLGKLSEALETLERIQKEPDLESIVIGQALIRQAEILSSQGELEKSKMKYIGAYKASPDNNFLIHLIADHFLEIKEPKNELFLRKRASEIQPNEPSEWATLGNVYLLLGLNDLAMNSYQKANELASGSEAWIKANIGNLLNNSGLYTQGASALNEALEMDKDFSYAMDRLGKTLEHIEEQKKKEVELLNEAEKILNS
jgi:tetratricopeptide (TPR) repeat protein